MGWEGEAWEVCVREELRGAPWTCIQGSELHSGGGCVSQASCEEEQDLGEKQEEEGKGMRVNTYMHTQA